jgi:hypothetical protein
MIRAMAVIVGIIAGVLSSAAVAYAAPTELHIRPDGTMFATNVIVKQKSGGNYFSRMAWGENAYARLVIVTNDATVVLKAYGEKAGRFDLQEGDTLDVEGKLAGIDGSISIQATKIIDHSLLRESKTLSGTAQSPNLSQGSFILSNKMFGNTTVLTTGTTTVQKGARVISVHDIVAGDKILAASGVYNYTNNTLAASSIEVHQDKSMFTPRNFQGTLKSIAGTALPTSMVITVGTADYTVYLPTNTIVLNNLKAAASISRFVAGDAIRFYGAIRQTNFTEVDAEVVRDTSF